MTAGMKPIHPGEVLLEVYMKPTPPGLTLEMLSEALGVPEQQLKTFINGSRSITMSLARQLSVVCRTTPEYWLQLQKTYDRQMAKYKSGRRNHVKGTRLDHPAAAA